jgi:hypothetical protein
MIKKCLVVLSIVALSAIGSLAQTADAFESDDTPKSVGLLDPSRLTIHHSVGFGVSSMGSSALKSQSLYATMIQYQVSKPLTLNLNFGIPLHSTSNSQRNLTAENIESAAYFQSMPFDVSLSWQVHKNLLMRFAVSRQSPEDAFGGGLYRDMFSDPIERYSLFGGF